MTAMTKREEIHFCTVDSRQEGLECDCARFPCSLRALQLSATAQNHAG